MRVSKINWTLWLAILAVIVGFGPLAMAQEPVTEEAATEDELIAAAMERSFEEEITVTGSLIPRADLAALSPVTVARGRAGDHLLGCEPHRGPDGQPAAGFRRQNSTVANGATGTATMDLRQLGTSRTLVLINGRRMASGEPGRAGILRPRHQHDPGRTGQESRRPDRRRVDGLRLRRRGRCGQLHHGHRLRGFPRRPAVQLLPARQQQRAGAGNQRGRRFRRPDRQHHGR